MSKCHTEIKVYSKNTVGPMFLIILLVILAYYLLIITVILVLEFLTNSTVTILLSFSVNITAFSFGGKKNQNTFCDKPLGPQGIL